MIKVDINQIKQWKSIPISELGELLQRFGFQFNKTFSFEDHRVFVNQDSTIKIVFFRDQAKVYTGGNNKNPVHAFSVIPDRVTLGMNKHG